MGKQVDLDELFNQYFNQLESFGLRSERFYQDYYHSKGTDPDLMTKWLRAAFQEGARAMAQDTLATLGDYATACSGIDEQNYTATGAFDAAQENLESYYSDVFGKDWIGVTGSLSELEMKNECNRMLAALVGPLLVDNWWQSKNRAFDNQTPAGEWLRNPERVYRYLQSHCYR